VLAVTVVALLDLKATCLGEECWDEAHEYAIQRSLVAQATLRGIVTSASASRKI
jgi:hypothetical protein